MRVVIAGRRASLDRRALLGEGGEATVLLHVERGVRRAVKLYKRDAARRVEKIEALRALTGALSDLAVLPQELVFDASSGAPIGYVMSALEPGHEPLASLSKLSYCAATGLDLGKLLLIAVELARGLARLHAAGVVVGDLNDQNELVHPARGRVVFIDCDSFQLANLPCEVATEAFLDPLLYGPDPGAPCATADGKPRWFGRGSDWYAFAVLVFRALTGVHPYGGVAPDCPTLVARARAHRSVLASGVRVPENVRARIEALAPALREDFVARFERAERRPFSLEPLLEAAAQVWRCSCGLELAGPRRPCPRCAVALGPSPAQLEVRQLASVTGRLFAVASDAARWAAFARDGEELVLLSASHEEREPRALRISAPSSRGWLACLTPELAAVAEIGPQFAELRLIATRSGEVWGATTTELAFGVPALAAHGASLFRVAKGTVIELTRDARGQAVERELGQVVSGQTLLFEAGAGVLAVTRVLGRRSYAWLGLGAFVELPVAPLAPGEALLDEWLGADHERVALVRWLRVLGRDLVCTTVFDRAGRALQTRTVPAERRAGGSAMQGALLARGSLLVAGEAGLVRHPLALDQPSTLFAQTEPHVVREAPLAACPRGVLVAAGGQLKLLTIHSSPKGPNP